MSWTAAVEADAAYHQGTSFDIDRRYWEAELEGLEAPVSLSARELLPEVEVPFPESTSIELSRKAYEDVVDFGRMAGGSTLAPFAAAAADLPVSPYGLSGRMSGYPHIGPYPSDPGLIWDAGE